jgi:glutamyl/glutaminyl-tRNA synthetase
MPNYQDGKIHTIVCNITDECYIGSTCEATVARRLAGHVNSYKRWKAGKGKKMTSFYIIDRVNYQILLIESFPCNSRDELHSREGQIIRKYKSESECECVNRCIAGRTKKVYYQDNKELIKISVKTYSEDNKEAIKEYTKQYSEKNKDKKQEYLKKYYENNKDKIKQYREDNKEELYETKIIKNYMCMWIMLS